MEEDLIGEAALGENGCRISKWNDDHQQDQDAGDSACFHGHDGEEHEAERYVADASEADPWERIDSCNGHAEESSRVMRCDEREQSDEQESESECAA